MSARYIIRGPVDTFDDCTLYWANVYGWGAREDATIFTQFERDIFDLPLEAVGWEVYAN
jgi:hypothetical protein